MIVTFLGHSQMDRNIGLVREWLNEAVDDAIARGARTFWLGEYGQFERMATRIVTEKKQQYPDICRVKFIPYLTARDFMLDDGHLPALYDELFYPYVLKDVLPRYAILKRNEFMADHADLVIAYVIHGWGGAATAVKRAVSRGKEVVFFDPTIRESFLSERMRKNEKNSANSHNS